MASELAVQIKNEDMMTQFVNILGGEHTAQAYVASVLLVVKGDPNLEKCNTGSIIKSALRAATLRLSVDPALKQAYLVPYGKNATLIPGWKGLYDMAMRTNKYSYINANEIKPGFTINKDPITGKATHEREEGAEGGWVASFQLGLKYGGLSHTEYMTHSQLELHKIEYAKGHTRNDSAWQTSEPQMKRKTVLRQLLQTWGIFDQRDKDILVALEEEQGEIIDAEPVRTSEEMTEDFSEEVEDAFPEGEYADLDAMSAEELAAADTKNTEKETMDQLGFGDKK